LCHAPRRDCCDKDKKPADHRNGVAGQFPGSVIEFNQLKAVGRVRLTRICVGRGIKPAGIVVRPLASVFGRRPAESELLVVQVVNLRADWQSAVGPAFQRVPDMPIGHHPDTVDFTAPGRVPAMSAESARVPPAHWSRHRAQSPRPRMHKNASVGT